MNEISYQDYIAAMMHEIKNPLAVIKTGIASAKQKTGYFEQELLIIEKETEKINQIVNEFLDFHVIRENTDVVYPYDIISEIINEQEAFHKEINFSLECGDRDICLTGNPKGIEILFSNLIKNSIEAIDGTGRIDIRLYKSGDKIVIEIEDDGTGIAPVVEEELFNSNVTTKINGTGLGLIICQKILLSCGGSIELKNLEKGTRVIIILKGLS